jgi:AraC family transcriptional regulator of arabinose operon
MAFNGMTRNAVHMPDPAGDTPAGDTPAPPPEAVVVGRFDERLGYAVHRSAGASSWLLTCTVTGAGRFRQGGSTAIARPGDVTLLGPSVGHDYDVPDEPGHWGFWWAHFRLRPSWQHRLQPHQIGPRLYALRELPDAVHGRVVATFRQLHADVRWSGQEPPPELAPAGVPVAAASTATPGSRDLALAGIETALLVALAAARDPADSADQRVRRAQARMIADPATPHTVASLAADVALSPSRFAHLFTTQTGQPPMQALHAARLEHAARLLEATELDIGRVARASGFASPFHFSRSFRARFGIPPRDYRQRS